MANLAGLRLALMFMLLSVVCLWPTAASAQSETDLSITAEQAQAAFAVHGFQVDPITDWGWPVPSIRSFVVHDLLTQRVLMVLVFPSTDKANEFRGGIAMEQRSSRSDLYVVGGIWA